MLNSLSRFFYGCLRIRFKSKIRIQVLGCEGDVVADIITYHQYHNILRVQSLFHCFDVVLDIQYLGIVHLPYQISVPYPDPVRVGVFVDPCDGHTGLGQRDHR